jgi:hypothetical protein
MFRVSLPDPAYASKTAWRFVVLVCSLSLLLIIAAATTRWWIHIHEAAWFIFAILFSLLLVVLSCFALAGVVWAALGLCRCSSEHRRLAWPALIAAVITFCIVGGYLLIFTGVIRLR